MQTETSVNNHVGAVVQPRLTEILVNDLTVNVNGPRITGLEIKEAAIAQKVPIQLDFVLSEELPNGRSRVVGDNDTITVNKHSKFLAIPNDDNS